MPHATCVSRAHAPARPLEHSRRPRSAQCRAPQSRPVRPSASSSTCSRAEAGASAPWLALPSA
eukprot:15453421-Alexandrium_andersonii.AAC.1